MNLKYLVLLFIVVPATSSINENCPGLCKCVEKLDHETILVIDCSNAVNMTEILVVPSIDGTKYIEIELNIQRQFFKSLPNISISGYDKVTLINATNNKLNKMFLQNIPPNLKVLDVTNNNLSAITTDIQDLVMKNGIQLYIAGNPWTRFCSSLKFKESNKEVEPYVDNGVKCKTEILVEKKTLAKNIHICNVIIILMICTVVILLGIFMIYQFCRKLKNQA